MKIKNIILIPVLCLFIIACSGRVKVVPEISNSLKEESLFQLKKGEEVVDQLILHNSELVYITLNGKMARLSHKEKMLTFLYNLGTAVEPHILHHKDTVILKKKEEDA
ncbi:MAG: hypothetical protein GY765_25560, partial [bacterium]|nr:hypothetical protein [bacterium]